MPSQLSVRVLGAVNDVSAKEWNAVVGEGHPPVLKHEWLSALERSGSASRQTGWEPHHFTAWRGSTLVGLAPAWRKHHSMGEYVYDFGWANAASRFGVEYYPKLLVGVPLSPLTARRFHAAPGESLADIRALLANAALDSAKEQGLSSVHVIFPPDEEAAALEPLGLYRRLGMQYHWRNPGYRSYDDYLSRFDSKRRNQLKRERGAAAGQGISLRTVRGVDGLSLEHARLAYRFYEATNAKNAWGNLQLNRQFFEQAFAAMPQDIELVLAEREGDVVAGAFNLVTAKRLYGRYWGCFEEHPFLHFHVCLYHSIDDCIRLGREAFEPGAGGEHKISRGFEPTAIHSVHRVFDRRLDAAIRDFCEREAEQVRPVLESSQDVAGMRPWSGATPTP